MNLNTASVSGKGHQLSDVQIQWSQNIETLEEDGDHQWTGTGSGVQSAFWCFFYCTLHKPHISFHFSEKNCTVLYIHWRKSLKVPPLLGLSCSKQEIIFERFDESQHSLYLRVFSFLLVFWLLIVSKAGFCGCVTVENLLIIKCSPSALKVYEQLRVYPVVVVVVQGCHFSLITVAASEAWTCKIVKILSDGQWHNSMALLSISACVFQFPAHIHLYFPIYLPDHNPDPSSLFLTIMKTSVCFVWSRVATKMHAIRMPPSAAAPLPASNMGQHLGTEPWRLESAYLSNASSALQCLLLTRTLADSLCKACR